VEAVVLEGEHFVIVSRYAGTTLKQCAERKLLSRAQLHHALQ